MARRRRALALALLAALCLHVQALSPIYQAMSTMYNSELSRGLQLGEGSEACCEHLEQLACSCEDQQEGTPHLITIDLPASATAHRCDSDCQHDVHHADAVNHDCVPEVYTVSHLDDYIEDSPVPHTVTEIVTLPQEHPTTNDQSKQSKPQTVVVVQCNQQTESSSSEEIVVSGNDEVTVVSGDRKTTDVLVIQENGKSCESDTIIVKENPRPKSKEDDPIEVKVVRGSFDSSCSSSSSESSSSSSSSSESSSSSSSSSESSSSSSSESSSSECSEEKSHQRHCKRVPGCKCAKCMLRRKLHQQQKEKTRKNQKQKRKQKRHS